MTKRLYQTHEPLDDCPSDEDIVGVNELIKRKCGSLRTNERSTQLPLLLKFVLETSLD